VTLNVAPVVLVILCSTAWRALSAPPPVVPVVLAVVPAGAAEPAAVVGELADPELQAVRMAPAARATTAGQAARRADRALFVLVFVFV
jgi:hypothetical protein